MLKIPLILLITANYFREFLGSLRDSYFSRTVQLIAKNSMKFEGMIILSEFCQLQSFLFDHSLLIFIFVIEKCLSQLNVNLLSDLKIGLGGDDL